MIFKKLPWYLKNNPKVKKLAIKRNFKSVIVILKSRQSLTFSHSALLLIPEIKSQIVTHTFKNPLNSHLHPQHHVKQTPYQGLDFCTRFSKNTQNVYFDTDTITLDSSDQELYISTPQNTYTPSLCWSQRTHKKQKVAPSPLISTFLTFQSHQSKPSLLSTYHRNRALVYQIKVTLQKARPHFLSDRITPICSI